MNISRRHKKGFSVIEVLLASGLFAIFMMSVVIAILQGLSMNRLGQEQTIAVQYASEGMDAVRSMRNQSFEILQETSDATIERQSGVWVFSNGDNILNEKFKRTISIVNAQRDTSGNIVESGGTEDDNTKKIVVEVAWSGSAQNNSVVLTTYLTNWRNL